MDVTKYTLIRYFFTMTGFPHFLPKNYFSVIIDAGNNFNLVAGENFARTNAAKALFTERT